MSSKEIINNQDTSKEIILELQGDFYHMKFSSVYPKDEVLKLHNLLFEAEENFKHYCKKEHASKNLKKYENILKTAIVLATNRRDKSHLEKLELIVGTYALISHVESPLYYLKNIDLYDYQYEEIIDMAEVLTQLPSAYLSVVCPVLVLPEVHERLMANAEDTGRSLVEEMKLFSEELIEQVNRYKKIPKNEENKEKIRKHQEVESLLNITSERGFSFLCSNTDSQLAWNNVDDKPNSLYFIHQLLEAHKLEEEKKKELLKK